MKRLIGFIVVFGLLVSAVAMAGPSTWGSLRHLYGSELSMSPLRLRTSNPTIQSLGISGRPYAVDEHWKDPNNPSSGEHVVLYFALQANMCVPVSQRLYNGSTQPWLNSSMLWVDQIGSNTMRYRLFIDGSWWWWTRTYTLQSAWNLSQRFQLVW